MSTNKIDRAFKTLINKKTTSEHKNHYEEFGARTLNIHANEVWLDPIDSDPAISIAAGIIELRTLFIMTEDLTVASQQAWNDGGLGDWVSDKYGINYGITLYDNGDNQIFPTDDSEWFFDFKTGILTFDSDNSSHSKPYKITGYRYIGRTVASDLYDQLVCTWVYQTLSLNNGDDEISLTGTFDMITSTTESTGLPIDSPLNLGDIKDINGKVMYDNYNEIYIKIEDSGGSPMAKLYSGSTPYIYDGDNTTIAIRFRIKERIVNVVDDAFAYDNFIRHNPRYPLERRKFTISEIIEGITIPEGEYEVDISAIFVATYGFDTSMLVDINDPNVGDKEGIIIFTVGNEYTKEQYEQYYVDIRNSDDNTPLHNYVTADDVRVISGQIWYNPSVPSITLRLITFDPDESYGYIYMYPRSEDVIIDMTVLRTISLIDMNHLIHANPSYWLPSSKSTYHYHKFPPDDLPKGVGTGGYVTERGIESDMISIPPRSIIRIPFKAEQPYRHVSMFIGGMLIPLAAGAFPYLDAQTFDIAADKARIFHLSGNGNVHSRSIEIIDKWYNSYDPYVSIARTETLTKTNPNTNILRVRSMLGMPKASHGSLHTFQLIINQGGSNEETVTYNSNNVIITQVNQDDYMEYYYDITLDANMSSGHFIGESVIAIPIDIPSTNYKAGYGPIPSCILFNQFDKSLYLGTLGDGLLILNQSGVWIQSSTEEVTTRDGYWDGPLLDDRITFITSMAIKTNILLGFEGASRIICIVQCEVSDAKKHEGVYTIDISNSSKFDIDGLPLVLTDVGGDDYYRWTSTPTCTSKDTGFDMDIGRPVIIGFNDGIYAGYLANGTEWPDGKTTWVDIKGNLPVDARHIHSIATSQDYPNLVAIGTEAGIWITVEMDNIVGVPAGDPASINWFKYTPPHGISNTPVYLVHFESFSTHSWDPNSSSFVSELPTLTFSHKIAITPEKPFTTTYFEDEPAYQNGFDLIIRILDPLNALLDTFIISFAAGEAKTTIVIQKINEETEYLEAYFTLVQNGLTAEPRAIIRLKHSYFDDNLIDTEEIPDYKISIKISWYDPPGEGTVIGRGDIGTAFIKLNMGTIVVQDMLFVGLFNFSAPIKYADFIGADIFAISIIPHPSALYLFQNLMDIIEYTQLAHPGCSIFWRNDGTNAEPEWNLYAVNPLTISMPVKIIGDVEGDSIPLTLTPGGSPGFEIIDTLFHLEVVVP